MKNAPIFPHPIPVQSHAHAHPRKRSQHAHTHQTRLGSAAVEAALPHTHTSAFEKKKTRMHACTRTRSRERTLPRSKAHLKESTSMFMHAHSCILHMLTYRCMCLNLGYPLSCTCLHICLYTLTENAVHERAHAHTQIFNPPTSHPSTNTHTRIRATHSFSLLQMCCTYIKIHARTSIPPPTHTHHTAVYVQFKRMAGFELQVTGVGMWLLATEKLSPYTLFEVLPTPQSSSNGACLSPNVLQYVLHCVIISVSPDTHTHTRAKASLLHARTRTHMPTYTHTHTHAPACMRSHPRTHKDSRVLLRLQFRHEPAQALMRGVELERFRLHSL